jgi:hypothetical protein
MTPLSFWLSSAEISGSPRGETQICVRAKLRSPRQICLFLEYGTREGKTKRARTGLVVGVLRVQCGVLVQEQHLGETHPLSQGRGFKRVGRRSEYAI